MIANDFKEGAAMSDPVQLGKLLDVQQIARRLEKRGVNLSQASIYRLAGEIPLVNIGPRKCLRARDADVDRWLAERCGLEVW